MWKNRVFIKVAVTFPQFFVAKAKIPNAAKEKQANSHAPQFSILPLRLSIRAPRNAGKFQSGGVFFLLFQKWDLFDRYLSSTGKKESRSRQEFCGKSPRVIPRRQAHSTKRNHSHRKMQKERHPAWFPKKRPWRPFFTPLFRPIIKFIYISEFKFLIIQRKICFPRPSRPFGEDNPPKGSLWKLLSQKKFSTFDIFEKSIFDDSCNR